MKTVIQTKSVKQTIQVSSNYLKDWDTYLVNIYSEDGYPMGSNRSRVGEEMTLIFDTKADVEKFISLIRTATRKIK
jgi:hypothetical protein